MARTRWRKNSSPASALRERAARGLDRPAGLVPATRRLACLALGAALACTALVCASPAAGIADVPFLQETHEPHPLGQAAGADDVRSVAVGGDGTVWTATRGGVFCLAPGTSVWRQPPSEIGAEPAFAVLAGRTVGEVLVGAWNGLFRGNSNGFERVGGLTAPVGAIALGNLAGGGAVLWAAGPDGLWRVADGQVTKEPVRCPGSVRVLLPGPSGEVWLGTAMGLFGWGPRSAAVLPADRAIGLDVRGLAWGSDGALWVGGLGGVTAERDGRAVRCLKAAQGLPNSFVQCVRRGPDGRVWIGTRQGVARYDGKKWSLRHSRRWLLDDDVRDVAFGPDGAAWVATARGVSALRARSLTLTGKAEWFHRVCRERHVRPPGLVEKCRLRIPGDLSSWAPEDDDNDGGYTAVYLAMESFRFAATGDAGARDHARQAFAALRFLQTVTGTTGFLARTVVPVDWTRMHDPNEALCEPERAARRVAEPRDKHVPERWRKSADGRWLWKGDTSSDEIAAHFFGYYFYYRLAADEADRVQVRDQVSRIVDHIAGHGFVLADLDGHATRWGVWAPERLNQDPNWAMERGINSVEILSFLKLAHCVTGDENYARHYRALLERHGYRDNVRQPKNLDPAWRTHIDDELLAFAWPVLILEERDPGLRRSYRQALERWHRAVAPDVQPFFEVLYSALTGKRGAIEPSLASLRDAPLDLVRWTVDNSAREDLRLVRHPELEHLQTDRLLPPSERGVPRTDENPRLARQGDEGRTESDGVFWLLPYWMARHYGLLAPAR